MNSKSQRMPYAKHRTKGIGAKTQMRFFSQKFKAVFFWLQGIFFCIAIT